MENYLYIYNCCLHTYLLICDDIGLLFFMPRTAQYFLMSNSKSSSGPSAITLSCCCAFGLEESLFHYE